MRRSDRRWKISLQPRNASGWTLVENGNPIWDGGFSQLWYITFSCDAKRIGAVVATALGKWTIAVDGKLWKNSWRDLVIGPVFSQDASKTAAVVKHDNRWSIAVDGEQWPDTYDMAWDPAISPDNRLVMAKVEKGGKYFIGMNGKLFSQAFDALWEPAFSPDGSKVLIRCVEGGKYYRWVAPVSQIAG